MNPNFVSSWSSEKFLWECESGHISEKTIYQKAVLSKSCYLCGVKAVSDFRLSCSYDLDKNFENPFALSSRSKAKAWWLCEIGHSFKRAINDQVKIDRKCPTCSLNGGSISQLELDVRESLKKLLPETNFSFNYRIIPGVFEVDIFIPDLNIAIDVNGEYWHSNAIAIKNGWASAAAKHENKFNRCLDSGVDLLYFWEDDWCSDERWMLLKFNEYLEERMSLDNIFKRFVSNRDK